MTAGLDPSRLVLPNGVVVVAKQTRKTPAVTISLTIRGGSVADPADAPGAMYLLSRVIDRGTPNRSASEIAEAFDSRGVSLGVSVTRQVLGITCTCLAADFQQIVPLLGEIVMTPTVPETELATRKGQVITSLRQDEDSPAVRAAEGMMTLIYGVEHPYGRRTKGTVESVQALTRERLLALHASRFGPAQLSAVLVGDVEPSRAQAGMQAVFGEWRATAAGEPLVVAAPARPSARRFVSIPMMNKAQADVAYGFLSIARSDPSYYAFMLMNNMLGEYAMGGRLGHSIREQQGMAYYVSSSFDASTIPGPFAVRAGVAAANVDRAIASIDAELRAIRASGVTGRELAESRQYLVGSLPRALETNAGIAGFLQNAEFFGLGLDYDRRLPTLLTMVTIDEVNAATALLDPDRATVVVAGPYQHA